MTASTQEREHVQARRNKILAYLDRGGQHSAREIADALVLQLGTVYRDLWWLWSEREIDRSFSWRRYAPYLWERRR